MSHSVSMKLSLRAPASTGEGFDSFREDCPALLRIDDATPRYLTCELNSSSAQGLMGAMREPLYLEDVFVGQRFVTASHCVTEAEIRVFADAYDPQAFHLDAVAAKESFFGGLTASGWHTAAITMRLQVEGGPPLAGGMIGAGGELSWPKPVRPGDTLHVESEIVAVTPSRSKPERGLITLRSETKNQAGEVVQLLTVKLLIWRRPEYGF
jgi:acyl dehydratase